MSEVSVRLAIYADLPGMMRVIGEARRFLASQGIDQWQDGYPDEAAMARDIAAAQAHVLCRGDELLGLFALCLGQEPAYALLELTEAAQGWLNADKPYAALHRVAIADSSRHSGISARLMQAALAQAQAQGCHSLRTDTHRGNMPMQRFLHKQGFEICGLVRYPVIAGDPLRLAYEKLI